MLTIEEKINALIPIPDISNIRAGKEWSSLSYYIKNSIVGREAYNKLSDQKDNSQVHMVEILHQTGALSFSQTADVIQKLYSKIFSSEKMIRVKIQDIQSSVDSEGHINYFFNGHKVEICWCPSVATTECQALLQYDEFNKLQKKRLNDSDSLSSKSLGTKFTYEDVVRRAYESGASDIHITYNSEWYNISFRINGKIYRQTDFIMSAEDGVQFVKQIKIDAAPFTKGKFNPDEHFTTQDAKIEFPNIGLDGVDNRLSFMPDGLLKNISMTARLLRRVKLKGANLEALGYYDDIIEKINIISKRQNGLVISSGITGSGKSTLISNILVNIDQTRRIYTFEDPVEYEIPLPNITQHNIYEPEKKENQASWAEYAKAAKRGDPDVVNFGELRKGGGLSSTLMEMSEAGQLVFTTVHITSCFSIYGAMLEIFDVRPEISVPLILFSINQVLVKTLCPHCKKEDSQGVNIRRLKQYQSSLPYKFTNSLEKLLEESEKGQGVTLFAKGDGCSVCGGSGYLGRTPVYEYMAPNVDFQEWLRSREHDGLPSKFAIEQKACRDKIGVNKLDIFIRKLRDGVIDASEENIFKIM